MPVIRQTIRHESGIPLGGIGTGSVEIRPDGLFHEWQVMNFGQWSPRTPAPPDSETLHSEDLLFLVRTCTRSGALITRILALDARLQELYSLPFVRPVEAIEYDAQYPVARLRYLDSALPVDVTASVWSPFVPLDARSSGTPGFWVDWEFTNRSDEEVSVSLAVCMRNTSGCGQSGRIPRNRQIRDLPAGWRGVRLSADAVQSDAVTTGDFCLAMHGGSISCVTGAHTEERSVLHTWETRNTRFGAKPISLALWLHEDGALPELDATRPLPDVSTCNNPDDAPWDTLLQHTLIAGMARHLDRVEDGLSGSPEGREYLLGLAQEALRRRLEWGLTALCARQQAPVCGSVQIHTALCWHFPNHINPSGELIGHKYTEWYTDSVEVLRTFIAQAPDWRRQTEALDTLLRENTMPDAAREAVAAQLSTLVKCTWWTRDGLFGVWEGLGCCGFHTTDITYQGSFPIIALFPELQQIQMVQGARFQREDGRVHHMLFPDLTHVDDSFERVDMNPQFVMLAWRDWLWTGDTHYLQTLWPHILRAMDNTALLDTDGDGLPDSDTRRNTYDAWDFTGCPVYIASLWLGALHAAAEMADELGEAERAFRWRATYDQGVRSLERLWNGSYYDLWVDGDQRDSCCMSDQATGDWFLSMCGADGILPADRLHAVMNAVMEYNFRPGRGLVNAAYPPDRVRRAVTSGNIQADAPWTGIEYTVAALLIRMGRLADGMAVVNDIHDRYLRAGRFWNHVECGNHYYRALSSWTLLLAFSSFHWNAKTQTLRLNPVQQRAEWMLPFFCPQAWGMAAAAERTMTLAIAGGQVTLQRLQLRCTTEPQSLALSLDGVSIGAEAEIADGILTLRFTQPMELISGSRLDLTVH